MTIDFKVNHPVTTDQFLGLLESPLWQDSWHYLIINQLGGSGVDSASLF